MAERPRDSALILQRQIARVFSLFIYFAVLTWLRLIQRYRIVDLRRIRKEFKTLISQGEGPVLICANHLTIVDSMLLIWAMASASFYFTRPELIAWNLPERKNYYHRWSLRLLCYLGKCVPVLRSGNAEQSKESLDQVLTLLSMGESVMIFPEGGRTRVGKVDTANYSYAVGRILQSFPAARVLCVYLRGYQQKAYSTFPVRNDNFFVSLQLFQPVTQLAGLRGMRELSSQIIQKLSEMERGYFEAAPFHWQ